MKSFLNSLACFTFLLVLAGGGIGAWYVYGTGAFLGSSDVYVAHPPTAVSAARQLVASFRKSAGVDESSQHLSVEQLPECLRIPRLRHAYVFRDHVNLVIGRSADWEIGARVWLLDATTTHADDPTPYHEISFYQYCNDIPISPKNLR